jgi:hypothetical protein
MVSTWNVLREMFNVRRKYLIRKGF